MDRRIEKTKRALYAAFMQLRRNKSVQEIRVAELCTVAEINKTTFYTHYKDIYELADEVEKQLLYKILGSIPQDKIYTFEDPAPFTKELMLAFERHTDELSILFSDSELRRFGVYLEQTVKQTIFAKYPHLKNDAELNILLTYCIHGAFNAQLSNRDLPIQTVVRTVEKIVLAMKPLMEGR